MKRSKFLLYLVFCYKLWCNKMWLVNSPLSPWQFLSGQSSPWTTHPGIIVPRQFLLGPFQPQKTSTHDNCSSNNFLLSIIWNFPGWNCLSGNCPGFIMKGARGLLVSEFLLHFMYFMWTGAGSEDIALTSEGLAFITSVSCSLLKILVNMWIWKLNLLLNYFQDG